MKAIFSLALLTVLLLEVKSWVLAVEKCHLSDSKCLLKSVQNFVPAFVNGIPELGIEKIYHLDVVSYEILGLKVNIFDAVLNLRNIVVEGVKWNEENMYFDLEFTYDSTLKGKYNAVGTVLVLPIDGDGDMEIEVEKLAGKIRIYYKIQKLSDGKDHIRFEKYSFDFTIKQHLEYKMTNLFKGNNELSDNLLKYLNSNWREVAKTFGSPVMEALVKQIYKNANHFFEKLPIEDIAIV